MKPYDVIIVGAGPAGSTLATLLGRQGLSVALLDKSHFPRDKVCGEYMSPQALAVLDQLQVLDDLPHQKTRRLEGLSVWSALGTSFSEKYKPVDGYHPFKPYGLAVSRKWFDEVLFNKAIHTPGVEAHQDFTVTQLLWKKDKVTGIKGHGLNGKAKAMEATLVVGADGTRSIVARMAGLGQKTKLRKYGFRAYYQGIKDENRGELHLGHHCYVGIAPVAPDLTNINLIVDEKEVKNINGQVTAFFETRVASVPGMKTRLAQAQRTSAVRCSGPLAWKTKSPVSAGVLLVGDAICFVDPFTGEGIFMALRGAQMAAQAIPQALQQGATRKSLKPYEKSIKQEFGKKWSGCWLVQKGLYKEKMADRLIGYLHKNKSLCVRLLAVCGDYLPPESIWRWRTLKSLMSPGSAPGTPVETERI